MEAQRRIWAGRMERRANHNTEGDGKERSFSQARRLLNCKNYNRNKMERYRFVSYGGESYGVFKREF